MTPDPTWQPLASRPYKVALALTVSLLLLTLTAAVILILINNAEQRQLTEEFELTLTHAFAALGQTATARAPALEEGAFAFGLAPEGVMFSAADGCEVQRVAGVVLDADGRAVDGYQVLFWGDYLEPQLLPTGSLAGRDVGAWSITLEGNVARHIWAQLVGAQRTQSSPVGAAFEDRSCERNHASIRFQQVAPPQ